VSVKDWLNYAKLPAFEVSPLNPLPSHRFDKSQIRTTFSLDQSPSESEKSLSPMSIKILNLGLACE